jgi:hypothetical protein
MISDLCRYQWLQPGVQFVGLQKLFKPFFLPTARFKPLKRLESIVAATTGLKPGANDGLHEGELPLSRSPPFRLTFFVTRRLASLNT